MNRKKILHLSLTKSIGGIASFQKNLLNHTDSNAVVFEFVTTYPDSAFLPFLQEKHVKIHRLPPQKTVLPYCWSLYRLLKEEQYTAVHIHKNSCANPMAFLVCRMAGVKQVIAHSHNTASVGGRMADLFHFLFRPLVRRLSTHKLACSTDAAMWLYGKKYCQKNDAVQIIKNGIDTKLFSYNEKVRQEVRAEFGWERRLVLGHVGNFIPQKNHFFLVDLISEITQSEKAAILLLFGRGDAMERVREYAIQKGVAEHIEFMGARTDIARFYQAMDLFLFPSFHEGLPIAGVEAQTADLPCLFSDAVTKEIMITDRAVSLSLDAGVSEWAKRAVSLAKTQERRNESEKIIAAGYDAAEMGKRMERIYGQQSCHQSHP